MFILFIVSAIALVMIIYETKRQGRTWPKVRGWWLRALLLNAAQVGTIYLAGVSWDRWLVKYQFWSLNFLGNTLGGITGYLVITFVFYWWHRFRHMSNFLWRWVHQVHHSPKRLEVITAFYKHPIELVADSFLSSLVLYPLLGLSPIAASYAVVLSGLAELFYHWNVKTPYWVGFIFQRPESHCVHHQDGLHAYNYSDLPLWDMLFGTFSNRKTFDGRCGLGEEGEHRLPEMLLGIDVSRRKRTNLKYRLKWTMISIFLIGLGLLTILGDVLNNKELKALGIASGASPAPKVFCTSNALETFSSSFYIEWTDKEGNPHITHITPKISAKMRGPYNRRNVYGAILSYGPVLEANPHMKFLYETALSYAVKSENSFFQDLGVELNEKVKIIVEPRQCSKVSHLNLQKEVFIE